MRATHGLSLSVIYLTPYVRHTLHYFSNLYSIPKVCNVSSMRERAEVCDSFLISGCIAVSRFSEDSRCSCNRFRLVCSVINRSTLGYAVTAVSEYSAKVWIKKKYFWHSMLHIFEQMLRSFPKNNAYFWDILHTFCSHAIYFNTFDTYKFLTLTILHTFIKLWANVAYFLGN